MLKLVSKNKEILFVSIVIFIFFLAYTTLAVVKHNHYLSGYDLAIADQIVWKYSRFTAPITTMHAYAFTSILADHVEIIYLLLSPFYWVFNSAITLIVLQTFFVTTSTAAVYLLAKRRKLTPVLCFSIIISYITFYGIQNTLWSDVHSLAFGTAFLAWFIYFLEKENKLWLFVSLLLALLCKEDIGLLTGSVSIIYFIATRKKIALVTLVISVLYLLSILSIYFPHFTHDGYRYAAKNGFFSDAKIAYLLDTTDKRQVYFYSFAWFGFLPLLAPLFVFPAFVDISHYFVFGHAVVAASQGLFLHYRISLAVLLIWPTIIALAKLSKAKKILIFNEYTLSLYVLLWAFVCLYSLHEPLTYLTKQWFWKSSVAAENITIVLTALPKNASVVAQSNITPHIAHRDKIFTLWPTTKTFSKKLSMSKFSLSVVSLGR